MHCKRLLLGVATLVGLSLLAMVPGAGGQSLSSRLRATQAQTQAAKQRVREAKAEQTTRRNQLVVVQRHALQAKESYYAAKDDLDTTRANLGAARKQYQACTDRLVKHDAAVCTRLRAMYEIGEPSYLEVLLDATTFSDFVERADYMKRIAQQDSSLLIQYVNDKKTAQALRDRLTEDEAREAVQVRALYQKRAEYESQQAQFTELLRKANTERAAAEQQLAEWEKASHEISDLLRRVQSGQEGPSAQYSGRWTGWGSSPIPSGYTITSPFGWRIHPITGRPSFHDGVDMACGYGTPIHAAASGLVIHAGWYGAYGEAIIIDHGSGWGTLYGHCSSLAVSAGQTVSAGQVIGNVGSTGFSTGPHLHFSVRRNGTPVPPF